MSKIKIFLASSGELSAERKEIELFIGKENKKYHDKSIFLDLVIWEDLCHSFHPERIQNHFNDEMLKCEIVIVLIFTKVGKFTKEEFDGAYKAFQSPKNPKYLYVYFKDAEVQISSLTKDYMQVLELKEEIQKIEQIYCNFNSIDNLKSQLQKQFDQIIPSLIWTNSNSDEIQSKNPISSSPSYSKLDEINNYIKHTSKKEKYYDEKNNIEKIEHLLKEDKTLSIVSCTGMGGVGKSTLAIEYANYALEKQIYDYAIWLGIESGVDSAIKQFCIRYLIVNDDGKQEIFFYLNRFIDFVNQDHKILLILDNYSSSSVSKEELIEFIERMKKQDILLTSREKTNIENQKTIEVDIFENVDDALEMFEKNSIRKYSENEKESLKKIIERLGLLPLAIEITAIYLSNYPDISVTDYYNELQKECVTTLEYVDKDDMPKLHKDNIRATLKIAAKVQQNPEMLIYLKLFSLFAAEPIAEEVLEFIVKELQDDFSFLRFKQTLSDLKRFYYIKQEENDYSMHRLLQEVLAEEYANDIDEKSKLVATISLGIFWWMKKAFDENKYGIYFDNTIAHIDHVLKYCNVIHESKMAKICLLTCKSAYIHSKTSEIALAYQYIHQAIDLLEQFEVNSEIEIVVRGQLANANYAKGDYPKALEEYKKVFNLRLNTLGENHPDIGNSYGNIGSVYYGQGEYQKALEEYKKALKIRLDTLGENHPNTATSYGNIGTTYCACGEYTKALEEYKKALKILLETVGKNHPDTATSYGNIGTVYYEQGEYSKALEEQKKALKIELNTVGENHPNTATSHNNIATVYHEQKEYLKALEEHQKALNIRLKTLGENHPSTAISYNNIGSIYRVKREYAKALEEYKKALKIRLDLLGESHPDTASSYNSIALTYYDQQEFYSAFKSLYNAILVLLNIEKNDLIILRIKSYYKSLNECVNHAQRKSSKDQKDFMRKRLKEVQDKAKELKIKLS